MPFTPYSSRPLLLHPSQCRIEAGHLRCGECGGLLRPRQDGSGWNCSDCGAIVTNDKRLWARYGTKEASDAKL